MLEIITPATTHQLTTLASVKLDLGILSADHDARLSALIDQSSAAVAAWCDRPFAMETVRETIFTEHPTDMLMLRRFPITLVISIESDGTEIEPNGYVVDRHTGLVHRRSLLSCRLLWPCGENVVSYSAGYHLPDEPGRTLPHDIERAVIMMVKYGYHAAGRDPLVRSINVEGLDAVSYFAAPGTAGLPLEVQGLLSPYRDLRGA